jgi:hypothetical protein
VPEQPILIASVNGTLSAAEREQALSHIADCASCPAFVNGDLSAVGACHRSIRRAWSRRLDRVSRDSALGPAVRDCVAGHSATIIDGDHHAMCCLARRN